MKKILVLLSILLVAVPALTAQYEFDQSLEYKNKNWSFYTSFKENTSLPIMDLGIMMSYSNDEYGDQYKSNVNADFKFFQYINPFAYFSFEEGDLNYKRAGAGVAVSLGKINDVFEHKAKLSATYNSSDSNVYAVGEYDARASINSVLSDTELLGIDANIKMAGYGQKYHLGAELNINKNLSLFGDYDYEVLHGLGDPVFKQGLRIRI